MYICVCVYICIIYVYMYRSVAVYSAETWTLLKVDDEYLVSFRMWCWRRMEISRTDRVRTEVLLRFRE